MEEVDAGEDQRALEEAVMFYRKKPLTEEELKAFGKESKFAGDFRVAPYVDVIEVGGRDGCKLVPILGVKVSF